MYLHVHAHPSPIPKKKERNSKLMSCNLHLPTFCAHFDALNDGQKKNPPPNKRCGKGEWGLFIGVKLQRGEGQIRTDEGRERKQTARRTTEGEKELFIHPLTLLLLEQGFPNFSFFSDRDLLIFKTHSPRIILRDPGGSYTLFLSAVLELRYSSQWFVTIGIFT